MAYVIGDDCIACGTCIGECPVEAISEGEKYSINPDLCTECGTCASVCPQRLSALASKDLIFDKSDIMVGWLNANRPFFFVLHCYHGVVTTLPKRGNDVTVVR